MAGKLFGLNSLVLPLIVVNAVVFLLDMLSGRLLANTFLLDPASVWMEPWTLLTSMFLHADFAHILFNMYGLFLFGSFLEQRIGVRRFALVYFGTGLLASFFWVLLANNPALGASGAVMGVIGALIVLMPNLQLLLFFAIPMPLWMAGIAFALLDLVGLISPSSGVANLAHLVGMGAGLGAGYYFRGVRRSLQRRMSGKTEMSEEDIAEYLRSGRI